MNSQDRLITLGGSFVPHYVHAPWRVNHDQATHSCLGPEIWWAGEDYYVYASQAEGNRRRSISPRTLGR